MVLTIHGNMEARMPEACKSNRISRACWTYAAAGNVNAKLQVPSDTNDFFCKQVNATKIKDEFAHLRHM